MSDSSANHGRASEGGRGPSNLGPVLHIPHASPQVPADARSDIQLDDAELANELLRMTDRYTDELFVPDAERGETAVICPVSRLVVDVERFPDDAQEPMAARGMGAVYLSRHDRTPLRADLSSRDALLNRYYWPHHAALEAAVEERLSAAGRALIIDCHSFPSRPLPYELVQNPIRPEICIGTDAFHTPTDMRDGLVEIFEKAGLSVAVDTPFSGSLVPSKCYRRDRRVASVMIEIRRDLYMDEETGEKSAAFDDIAGITRAAIGAAQAAFDQVEAGR